MKQARYLDLLFENCESIILPIERVEMSGFDMARRYKEDPFGREHVYCVEQMTLAINYSDVSELWYRANEQKEPLGMFVANPTSNRVQDRPNILGRILSHKDVVGFELLDEKEEPIQLIYLPWGNEPFTNTCMNTTITDTQIILTFHKEETPRTQKKT